jgi:tetratricopeptide (TPR) repeat protein
VIRGAFHVKRRGWDRAIVDFQQATVLAPESPDAFQNLGNVYLAQNQFDQAIGALHRVYKLNPKNAGACLTLGEAYSMKGESGPAILYIDIGMNIDPTNPRAHQIRALQAMVLFVRRDWKLD